MNGGGCFARPLVTLFLLSVGCVAREPLSIEAVVILLDVSDGATTKQRCRELGPRMKEVALRSTNFDLAVMTSGGTDEPNPSMLIDWYKYRATSDTSSTSVDELSLWFRRECEKTISTRRGSALRRSIIAASLELESHCLALGARIEMCSRRTLIVHSEFQESEDLDIQRALRASTPQMADLQIRNIRPSRAVSERVHFELCGVATSTVGPVLNAAELIWAAALGRALRIAPVCAQSGRSLLGTPE